MRSFALLLQIRTQPFGGLFLLGIALILPLKAASQQLPEHFVQSSALASKATTVQASFRQSKNSSLFAQEQVQLGSFAWKRPDRLRWGYSEGGAFVRSPDGAWWVDKKGKAHGVEIPRRKDPIAALVGLMTLNLDGLSEVYAVAELDPPDDQHWRFVLSPVKKAPFESVQVDVQRLSGLADEVRIAEKSGDQTVIVFDPIEVDQNLSDSLFEPQRP